ncbi:MAG: YybH family protein [Isosphaeraceae bacterium]
MRVQVLEVVLMLGSIGPALAQDSKTSSPARVATEVKASPEEHAIREADGAFVEEYNKGDAKALAARFTEDAEVIEADGMRYRGRALIEERLAQTFAASPGIKLEIMADSIVFLSPDVAKEEGRTVVKPAGAAVEARRHTALLVKREGKWLISSVREELDPLLPPHERLKELAWMVGDWVDDGPDSHIKVSCRWSADGNFLLRTFLVHVQGKPTLAVHQRVGWDPLAKQFRSWEFDSEGGYGEGRWSRDGDAWVIKHTGVRPEGITASATHLVARERPDLVRWVSTDRIVGDERAPGDEESTMVRVPPAPQTSATAPGQPAASPATSKKTRSPQ